MNHKARYEYEVIHLSAKSMLRGSKTAEGYKEEINQLASQGWRLINIVHESVGGGLAGIFAFFERPIK